MARYSKKIMMKRNVIRVGLLLLAMLLALTGCKGGTDTTRESETEGAVTSPTSETSGKEESLLTLVENGVARYYVVVLSPDFEEAAEYIKTTVKQKANVELKTTSFENSEWTENKIYLGSNYEELCPRGDELTYLGRAVVFQDETIHICANTPTMMKRAAQELFTTVTEEYITENASGKRTMMLNSANGFLINPDYPINNATLLQAPISDYCVVYGAGEQTARLLSESLSYLIGTQTGYKPKVVSDAATQTEREILVGVTNRTESPVLPINEYAVRSVGSKVQISGSYAAIGKAVESFKGMFGKTELSESGTVTGRYLTPKASDEIRIMSSNTGIPSDRKGVELTASQRATLLGEAYEMLRPDFIGLQEAGSTGVALLQSATSELYGFVSQSEQKQCPILYLKSEWQIVKEDGAEVKGFEMFEGQAGWCYEWVMFERIDHPNERIIMMNLHFQPSGELYGQFRPDAIAKTNAELCRLTEAYPNIPIAVTGDYNSKYRSQQDDVFKPLYQALEMDSAAYVTTDSDFTKATYHSIGTSSAQGGEPIDHISITTDLLDATRYCVVEYEPIGKASDHFPIFIDVRVKPAS